MLKFKKELTNVEEKELCRNSYITEIAFYIGTKRYIDDVDDVIKEKLVNLVAMDGMYAFNLYVNFVAKRFMESDVADVYTYTDRYWEDDLADFIQEYFEEV